MDNDMDRDMDRGLTQPSITLWAITQKIAQFLIQHAPDQSARQHWDVAKGVVQHQYGLSPLAWGCGLQDCMVGNKVITETDFDWLWDNVAYAGAPLSRIVGYGWFCGRRFDLNADTLDPRWETEGIIDLVWQHWPAGMGSGICDRVGQSEKKRPQQYSPRILDVGTGSGCILITLLANCPEAVGVGIDISTNALQAAKNNALRHGVEDRALWVNSHGLSCFEKDAGLAGTGLGDVGSWEKFDIIVSNPPYVPKDFPVSDDVKKWDPPVALYAGMDGLDIYRAWIGPMAEKLADRGVLVLEIGHDQGGAVVALCEKAHLHAKKQQDADGKDRYVWAVKEDRIS